MAQEIRKIILEEGELVACLESYRQIASDFLPFGKIIGTRAGECLSIGVLVEIVSGNTVQVAEYDFKCADLTLPILHYCAENDIPLPRRGRKSVGVADGRATLFVTFDSGTAGSYAH